MLTHADFSMTGGNWAFIAYEVDGSHSKDLLELLNVMGCLDAPNHLCAGSTKSASSGRAEFEVSFSLSTVILRPGLY